MEIVILDAKTIGDDINLSNFFGEFGNVTVYDTTHPSDTLDRVKNADIVITNKVVIDKQIMEKSNIKLIAVTATGMNNIDLKSAKELNIEVKNVSGYSTNSVVQHTFALLFYLLEQLRYYDDFVKDGLWSKSKLFTNLDKSFFEIAGKKWGIIGLGEIGKNVANIAKSFGCDVIYYSTSGKNNNKDFKRVELKELLSTSDIISIHAPLNQYTNNLLNKTNLHLLKPKSILLNLGRGGIINEDDLATILEEKDIFVGLDVLSNEPIDKNSKLLKISKKQNIIITPHIAWTSIEARKKLLNGVYKNIKDFINRC